ncbi:MAG: pseudaminic acid synthase [Chlorobi bacterium]|nr:pseudaminic acid synthase [Chlorobiota bacterium]
MKIAGFELGKGKTMIVAELSANHGHDLEIAKRTIRAAKQAGADAIKLQTYTPDTLTIDCRKDDFVLNHGTLWDGRTLYELYGEAYTPWGWHEELCRTAREEGLICFSSPFDKTAVDFLEQFRVPAYKIASFEITDIPLIEYAARKGKPMIMSTGIATRQELEDAVNACRRVGNNDIILLKTSSQYPAAYEDANLAMIRDMAERFGVMTGLSDHTEGWLVPALSVPAGAVMIEKHFILDKSIGGPDAAFSLDKDQFAEMVRKVREAEKIYGKVDYSLTEKAKNSRVFARSLYVVKDMKKGEVFTEENLRSIRPGYGMPPKFLPEILGKRAARDIRKGTRMEWDLVEK